MLKFSQKKGKKNFISGFILEISCRKLWTDKKTMQKASGLDSTILHYSTRGSSFFLSHNYCNVPNFNDC